MSSGDNLTLVDRVKRRIPRAIAYKLRREAGISLKSLDEAGADLSYALEHADCGMPVISLGACGYCGFNHPLECMRLIKDIY